MSAINKAQTDILQERIKSLRESIDRADALASAQARTIAALEGSLALYDRRVTELENTLKMYAEAS